MIDDYERFSGLLGTSSFLKYPEYVFRGHRDPSWRLLPSLYRRFQPTLPVGKAGNEDLITFREKVGIKTAFLLKHFLLGLRGTQWYQPGHEQILNWFTGRGSSQTHINELFAARNDTPGLWIECLKAWSVGQHYGLQTPLLDWTKSLFAAFYFAFSEGDERDEGDESRAVFALNRRLVEERCKRNGFAGNSLEFMAPYVHNNARMIAQQGLFSYSHTYQSIEDWVADNFANEAQPVLIKLLIKNVKTSEAIRWLNRAGVSDRTMYPDIEGISWFSNRTIDDNELDYI